MNNSRTVDGTGRYVGPSASRIAELLPHWVSLERGWFRTTTATCHGGRSDGLAFRQRPDGGSIDVRCHSGRCIPGVILARLEALIGLPIRTAWEPVSGGAASAPRKKRWTRRRIALAGVAALVIAAPLLLGMGLEEAALNLLGLGIGALLLRRLLIRRTVRRSRR